MSGHRHGVSDQPSGRKPARGLNWIWIILPCSFCLLLVGFFAPPFSSLYNDWRVQQNPGLVSHPVIGDVNCTGNHIWSMCSDDDCDYIYVYKCEFDSTFDIDGVIYTRHIEYRTLNRNSQIASDFEIFYAKDNPHYVSNGSNLKTFYLNFFGKVIICILLGSWLIYAFNTGLFSFTRVSGTETDGIDPKRDHYAGSGEDDYFNGENDYYFGDASLGAGRPKNGNQPEKTFGKRKAGKQNTGQRNLDI